jgi:hypothetical protein
VQRALSLAFDRLRTGLSTAIVDKQEKAFQLKAFAPGTAAARLAHCAHGGYSYANFFGTPATFTESTACYPSSKPPAGRSGH